MKKKRRAWRMLCMPRGGRGRRHFAGGGVALLRSLSVLDGVKTDMLTRRQALRLCGGSTGADALYAETPVKKVRLS